MDNLADGYFLSFNVFCLFIWHSVKRKKGSRKYI